MINEKKLERFETVAIEALEQSGGLVPMELEFLDTVPHFGENVQEKQLLLDTKGTHMNFGELASLGGIFNVWV